MFGGVGQDLYQVDCVFVGDGCGIEVGFGCYYCFQQCCIQIEFVGCFGEQVVVFVCIVMSQYGLYEWWIGWGYCFFVVGMVEQ